MLGKPVISIQPVLMILLAVSLSCDSSQETQDQSQEPPLYSIHPTAVISADEFDTLYTLGAVSDVNHLSDGNIAVLDRLSASAYIFSPSGEYLTRAGRRGSGPGEFNSPDAIVPFPSDSMLIFDRTIRRISVYSENGTHIHDMPENFEFPVPYWSKYNGPGRYVGGIMYMNSNSEGYEIEYSICSFGNDLCPVDTFFTNKAQMIPDDITNTIQNSIFSCAFTCDSEGNVFVAPVSAEKYIIQGYNSRGECFLTIERDITPVRKTDEELARETERFNSMFSARNSGAPGNYSPGEFRYTIPPQGLHADNLGRLWVLDGTSGESLFDVFDYSGELLFTVKIQGIESEETVDMLWWNVSEHGLLAFSLDPVNVPKVYVFEFQNSGNSTMEL